MRRVRSSRPPFENRWTSGSKAWVWHQELEAIGVENVRVRLALQDAPVPVGFTDAEIPEGFVRDWLIYHDRKARRGTVRWRVFIALLATAAAIVALWAAWLSLAPGR
jgi:hypothetical protein